MLVTVGSEGWGLARPAAGVLVPVAIAAVSVAAFVTVFEHDLYDLDLVVTRTVTFGLLVAVITGGYVVVAGVGTALGTAGELSLGLAVLGTAVVAVAFQPVRRRVNRFADRLVCGPQANPHEVLATLPERMGGTLDATGGATDGADRRGSHGCARRGDPAGP